MYKRQEYEEVLNEYNISVKFWSRNMEKLYECCIPAEKADGRIIEWKTGLDWEDCYFFFTIDLKRARQLICRQVYWPKSLKMMENKDVRNEFRKEPQENLRMEKGPWLKEQISLIKGAVLKLEGNAVKRNDQRIKVNIKIKNIGETAAFPVILEFPENGVRGMMQDNYFWLEAGEERTLWVEADISNRISDRLLLSVSSWNAEPQNLII